MKTLLLVFCIGQMYDPDMGPAWDLYFECMDLNLATDMADGQYNMQRVCAKWYRTEAERYHTLCEELDDLYTLSDPPPHYYELPAIIEAGDEDYNWALHHYDHPYNPPEPTIGFLQLKQAADEYFISGVSHLNIAQYSEAKADFEFCKYKYETAQHSMVNILNKLGEAYYHYYSAWVDYKEYYMQWSMDPSTIYTGP